MMNSLRIRNFKCFENTRIPIYQLTVMAGANGYGKSTSIQAILFFRQTIERCYRLYEGYYISERQDIKECIPLNESFLLALGNSADIINRQSSENEIQLGFSYNERDFLIDYLADNYEPRLYLTTTNLPLFEEATLPLFKQEFYYLNAERIGPRLNQAVHFFNYPNAGWKGEFVAQLISERGGYLPVEKERLYRDTTNPGLEFQVNEWLNEIMPGVRILAKQNPITFTSQIQVENAYTKGDPVLATNIGFGISYILPIIATGLVAQKGSCFIVENPEAHLHPAAQSKLGQFLAMIAASGVQVIVETHSDHIINGIQIAVAKKQIGSENVGINFFQESENHQPFVIPIKIKEKGELTDWPKGFFDQSQIDYSYLIKLRRDV